MEIISQDNTLDMIEEKFKAKCKELSVTLNTKVNYEFFKERNDDGEPTGKIFVAYIRQPLFLAASKYMDMLMSKRIYEAGAMAFDTMVLKDSDSEVFSEILPYKIGLAGRVGFLLNLQAPEDKKK